jgi:DNA-binding transcriptional ArsR family regulator
MESAFAVLAEPNRRAILGLLASAERSVGEFETELGMPQPSVSKHLRVLRDAGFVEARVDAQRRVYRLKPEPLMEVDAWLEPFRRFWEARVDALESYLDRMQAEERPPRARKDAVSPESPKSSKSSAASGRNPSTKKGAKR